MFFKTINWRSVCRRSKIREAWPRLNCVIGIRLCNKSAVKAIKYWIGDKVFKLEGDVPDFTGYEKELLTLIGASEEDYKVESVSWDGEAYEDANGVRCRNAVAKGKKLVRDCTVTYEGSAVFPEETGVRYVSTYMKEGGECQVGLKCTLRCAFPGIGTPWMSSLPCCIN